MTYAAKLKNVADATKSNAQSARTASHAAREQAARSTKPMAATDAHTRTEATAGSAAQTRTEPIIGTGTQAQSARTAPACSSKPSSTQTARYTYKDCLLGTVPVPKAENGATLFKVLMVGGMVTFMVTVNGMRQVGPEFLAQSHWLYPLMFCLAFLVRTYIGDALVNAIAPRTVLKWFQGPTRGIAMTVLNVLCMAPIMCAIATLLLHGIDGYLFAYFSALPIVIPIAILVNFFIVGPAVKLVFNNRITPAGGINILANLREQTAPLTNLFGC